MPQAVDDLARLHTAIARRIVNKLRWLSQNYSNLTPETLTGDMKGFCKLRAGSYRIIYTANQKEHVLMVHLIGHRRDIYRR